ncbi:MAG: hypothetical protein AB7S38_26165 [Vulcanimicrobiota bacterium]
MKRKWENPIVYRMGVPGTLGGMSKMVNEGGHVTATTGAGKVTAYCHDNYGIGKSNVGYTKVLVTGGAGASAMVPTLIMAQTTCDGIGTVPGTS